MGKKVLAVTGTLIIGVVSSLVANALGVINIKNIFMVLQIPLWSILLIVILLLTSVLLNIYFIIRHEKKRKVKRKSDLHKKTSIDHGGHLFVWEYLPNGEPHNIREICYNCGGDIGTFGCDNCRHSQRRLLGSAQFIEGLKKAIRISKEESDS